MKTDHVWHSFFNAQRDVCFCQDHSLVFANRQVSLYNGGYFVLFSRSAQCKFQTHLLRSNSLEIMELIPKNNNLSINNLKLASDAKFYLQYHFRPNVCGIVYFTEVYQLFPKMQFKSLRSQAEIVFFSKHIFVFYSENKRLNHFDS